MAQSTIVTPGISESQAENEYKYPVFMGSNVPLF